MDSLSYKTIFANKETVQKNWLVVDAKGLPLGRLASQVAKLIQGKHKVDYSPQVNCGDHVVVINTDLIKLTGKKWTNKVYVRHTGYPGGQRFSTPRDIVRKKSSTILVEMAVRRMLPKNRLRKPQFFNMHLFAGAEHKYQDKNPVAYQIEI